MKEAILEKQVLKHQDTITESLFQGIQIKTDQHKVKINFTDLKNQLIGISIILMGLQCGLIIIMIKIALTLNRQI